MRRIAFLLATMAALVAAPAWAQYYDHGSGGWRAPPPDEEWQDPDDDDGPPPRSPFANPPAPPGGGWRNGAWSPTHRCSESRTGWCWNY